MAGVLIPQLGKIELADLGFGIWDLGFVQDGGMAVRTRLDRLISFRSPRLGIEIRNPRSAIRNRETRSLRLPVPTSVSKDQYPLRRQADHTFIPDIQSDDSKHESLERQTIGIEFDERCRT